MTTPYSASRTVVRAAQPPLDEHTMRLIRQARAQRRRRRSQRVLTRA
jgi:uncharacterized protein YjiS (DUF1127 family)